MNLQPPNSFFRLIALVFLLMPCGSLSATYGRFELFDLAQDDPGQTKDVSKQHPEIVAKLKQQLLDINASVMADAPDWHLKSESGEVGHAEDDHHTLPYLSHSGIWRRG
jgi:hypothetical protein